jgi:spermidine synthase
MTAPRPAAWPAYLAFFLSGVAGLGYEIVWTRQFAVGLGHEIAGVLAVVAAFFGGFAVGAWVLDGVVSRSRRPGAWYAGLEAVVGAWAVATMWLIPALGVRLAAWIGADPPAIRHWTIAFAVPFLALLPATAAMGATLPAMERCVSRLRADGRSVGGLYGVNAFGAMVGTLGAVFVLMPRLGLRGATLMLAAGNAVCAVVALLGPVRGEADRAEVEAPIADAPGRGRLLAAMFLTGLLGIGYEVLCVRVMGQVLEGTIYSFAAALAVYLLGTAAGAGMYQGMAGRGRYRSVLTWLLEGIAFACLLGVIVLWYGEAVYERLRFRWGGGVAASILAEMALALLVLGLPSMLMGATFSHLAQGLRRRGGGVGRGLSLNTLGGALAPVLFGVVLLPLVGAKATLVAAALAYLLLIPTFAPRALAPALASVVLLPFLPPALKLVQPPPGGQVAVYREGVMAATAVVTDREGRRFLKINNRFAMGGTAGNFAERRQAHIPLLLHPAPRTALFLGAGTGVTLGASVHHEGLHAVGVELVPEAVELMSWFASDNENVRRSMEITLHAADARRFVQATDERFDVIVADLFHPARDGAASLYTREHFAAIRARLAPDGVFCQWLPLYQLDGNVLRVIVRTWLAVFPEGRALLCHYNVETPMLGLVWSEGPPRAAPGWMSRRAAEPLLAAALVPVMLTEEEQLFGTFVGDAGDLGRFAGEGAINTDDRPEVAFAAPRFVYARDVPPQENVRALLEACDFAAEKFCVTDGPEGAAFAARLGSYAAARDLYLRGAIADAEHRREEALGLYLESLRASRDFRTSYNVLLLEARGRMGSNPTGARRLLAELVTAHPQRDEAWTILRSLPGGAVPLHPEPRP